MFSEWNEPMLNQIYYHFQFKDLKINEIIYKENDEASNIYLVKEGEIEISKNLEINLRSPTEAESLLINFTKENMKKYNCKYKQIRQALITQGQVFGQEEILNKTKRLSMAICVSDKVKIFILDKEV
jgi:CRP-like cAMP-binding protein